MIITNHKEDYIEVDERWLIDNHHVTERKVHLVKLCFQYPCVEKLEQVLDLLPKTNRFIVCDNIKIYNDFFKKTRKKYYVENSLTDEARFVSFLRKNNKILLDITKVTNTILRYFIFELTWDDILKNVEIIKMSKEDYAMYGCRLHEWSGNVIVVE